MMKWLSLVAVGLLVSAPCAFAESSSKAALKSASQSSDIAKSKSLRALRKKLASSASNKSFNLNLTPVFEMVAHLERRGADVKATIDQVKGNTFLNLTLDGEALPPLLVQCDACEVIVFEY